MSSFPRTLCPLNNEIVTGAVTLSETLQIAPLRTPTVWSPLGQLGRLARRAVEVERGST